MKPNESELREIYSKRGENLSTLSRKYGYSRPIIRKWLKEFNIPIKSQQQASTESNNKKREAIPSKEKLLELYDCFSLKDMEKAFNVGQETIYQWLDQYNIQRKSLSDSCKIGKEKRRNDLTPNKEELIKIYNRFKNQKVTAEYFNISQSFLRKVLNKYSIDTHIPQRSKAEIELYEFCVLNFPEYKWEHSNKSVINPFELDIYCEELQLAIEYCGLYWHSEYFGKKDKHYHQKKHLLCKEKNIKLLTVFESDSIDKVKKFLLHRLSKNNAVYGRQTEIKELQPSEASTFHNEYHMNSAVGAKVHYGLYKDNELLQVCSFGKSRYSKDEYEIIRYTSKIKVIGGFAKLLSRFITEHNPETLITFADARYGYGDIYKKNKFEENCLTAPNYFYFHKSNSSKVYSRVMFQKHKLKDKLIPFNENLTEYENMKISGYDRVWDCGNYKYTYKNNKRT